MTNITPNSECLVCDKDIGAVVIGLVETYIFLTTMNDSYRKLIVILQISNDQSVFCVIIKLLCKMKESRNKHNYIDKKKKKMF